MSKIIDYKTNYISSSIDGAGPHQIDYLSGVKIGDLLIMYWGASDDNLVSLDNPGWTQLTGASITQISCEIKCYYKFATSDNEQPSPFSTTSTSIVIYMHGIAIRGVNTTTPFADSQSFQETSNSTTINYPTVTATAENQLAIYMANSDGGNITPTTEPTVRLITKYNDNNLHQKVVNTGVVASFTASIPGADQWNSSCFIINDDTSLLRPLEIHPIKALSTVTGITHNEGGWREAIYSSGKSIFTGENRVVYNPAFEVFSATNQYVLRVDNFSGVDFTSGENITIGSETAILYRVDMYTSTRGYMVVGNRSGSGIVTDNTTISSTTTTASCLIFGGSSSYQHDVTNYFRSDNKLNTYQLVKISAMTSISISDGIYFLKEHRGANNSSEGYYYSLTSDADAFENGTLQTLTAGTGTATMNEYNMCTYDYNTTDDFDYPRPANGQFGRFTNITGNCRKFITPRNMSDKILAIWTRARNLSSTKAVYFLAIDNSNGWKLWKLWKRYGQTINPELAIINLNSTETPITQSGSFDITNVSYYGILATGNTNTSRDLCYTYEQYILAKQYVTGGGVTSPVTFKDIDLMLSNEENNYGTIYNESIISNIESQYIQNQNLSLGDGTKYTYFEMQNKALSLPAQADGINNFMFNLDKNKVGIEINNVSGNITNNIIYADKGGIWYSNSGDTLDYSGSIFIKQNFITQHGKIYNSINLIDCGIIENKTAKFLNCIFENTTLEIDSSITEKITDLNFKDCDYALRITGSDDFYLENITIENCTKDLYFTATTGTINITIGSTSTESLTYDTAGVTVNFITAPSTVDVAFHNAFNGVVYIDVDNGIDNSAEPFNGTELLPCKTYVRAFEISQNPLLKINTFQLAGTLILDQNVDGKEFIGWKSGKIDLNNQSMLATRFRELELYGTQNTVGLFYDCRIANLQGLNGVYEDCKFLVDTALEVQANAGIMMNNCVSQVPGSNSPTFNYANGNISLNMRNYCGGIKIINSANANNVSTYEFVAGKFNFDTSNTLGSFDVRGVIDDTNINSGGATVTLNGAVSGGSGDSGGATASEIWSYATRILTGTVTTDTASRTASKADISGLATESNATTNKNSIITEINANETKLDIIDTNVDTINTNTANVNQYKADVSGLSTEANATTNKNSIIAKVNANETKLDIIDTNIDNIKVVIDTNLDAKITTRNAIAPDNTGISDIKTKVLTLTNYDDTTTQAKLDIIERLNRGSIKIENNKLTLYDSVGTIQEWNLFDENNDPSNEDTFYRIKI